MLETATPRDRRHATTRREILDAAWRLAEERGIAGLSFREVARSVGMRAPSLYTYFDSKDALYDAMFAEGYEQFGSALDEWSSHDGIDEPVNALSSVLADWIRFCQASLARYQIMFTNAIPGWEPTADAYAVSVTQFERMEATLAEFGIRTAADIDLFTALGSGLVAQQMANDPGGDRWVKLAPIAAQMFLDDLARRTQ